VTFEAEKRSYCGQRFKEIIIREVEGRDYSGKIEIED